MLNKVMKVAGSNFQVLTDNTTTQGALQKSKSRSYFVNKEWKILYKLMINLDCMVTEKRVVSKDNVADALSRGLEHGLKARNEVVIKIPDDLSPFLIQC